MGFVLLGVNPLASGFQVLHLEAAAPLSLMLLFLVGVGSVFVVGLTNWMGVVVVCVVKVNPVAVTGFQLSCEFVVGVVGAAWVGNGVTGTDTGSFFTSQKGVSTKVDPQVEGGALAGGFQVIDMISLV